MRVNFRVQRCYVRSRWCSEVPGRWRRNRWWTISAELLWRPGLSDQGAVFQEGYYWRVSCSQYISNVLIWCYFCNPYLRVCEGSLVRWICWNWESSAASVHLHYGIWMTEILWLRDLNFGNRWHFWHLYKYIRKLRAPSAQMSPTNMNPRGFNQGAQSLLSAATLKVPHNHSSEGCCSVPNKTG